ncbi:hypothetical protein [Caldicellulosiruptor kronotskyensis]|nr:hypothetical protein [Caldicellulosiruptor kronotskyensis]
MREQLDKDAAKIEFEEFKKFIEKKGTYRAALFYASQNQKIR